MATNDRLASLSDSQGLTDDQLARLRYIDNWADVLERYGNPDDTITVRTIISSLRDGRRGPKCPTCSLPIDPGTVHEPGYGAHCIPKVVTSA